ncbi:acyl-CoA dehydrogenase family protein [Lewinella sp. IMCC34191]|uniref:acyl-CoA dehydrogenase family protein n=1 Tax=Lewinella sp. IMCC34191 TaxID=2259172 RepID=UPI000E277954|nr:acyl-CoA dehydrogenase family protein [Lewinella sp. IMCC34191]
MAISVIPQPTSSLYSIGNQIKSLFGEWAADTYAHGGYPALEMRALADSGLLTSVLPGAPLDPAGKHHPELLDLLRIIGEGNLSVGRIFEGHVNALQLIGLYATEDQKERWYDDARQGHLFGVWNTEMGHGVRYHEEAGGQYRTEGSKTYCSGSVQVTRPIVTGQLVKSRDDNSGWQMAVLPLDRHEPEVDRSFWTTAGMRNSVSYKIDFTGIHLGSEDLLGEPDDYNRQPHLSGGAVRFAAVQLGGAEAILEHTRTFLQRLNRSEDPVQRRRIGQMVVAVSSGKLWLQQAGSVLNSSTDSDHIIFIANQVRTAIAEYCRLCLDLSDQSVGSRGMLPPEPLARLHADLRVYLRQPAPDAALSAIGQYFLNGPS